MTKPDQKDSSSKAEISSANIALREGMIMAYEVIDKSQKYSQEDREILAQASNQILRAIMSGADVNFQLDQEHKNYSPLIISILSSNLRMIEFLIDKGARIDQIDSNNSNALHHSTKLLGDIFILFFITSIADLQESSLQIFNQESSLNGSSLKPSWFIIQSRSCYRESEATKRMKNIIACTHLNYDHENICQIVLRTKEQNLAPDQYDREICDMILTTTKNPQILFLMNHSHQISRETLQIIGIIEVRQVLEIDAENSDSQDIAGKIIRIKLSLTDNLIKKRLTKLTSLLGDRDHISKSISMNQALHLCCSFLSKVRREEKFYDEIFDLTKRLLELGASPNYQALKVMPLIFFCCSNFDRSDLVKILIDAEANINTIYEGKNILDFNIRKKNYETVKLIAQHAPFLINSRNPESLETPLHFALSSKDYKAAEILINHGGDKIDYSLTNKRGLTALDLIREAIALNEISESRFDNPEFRQEFTLFIERENQKKDELRRTRLAEILNEIESSGQRKNRLATLIAMANDQELTDYASRKGSRIIDLIIKSGNVSDLENFFTRRPEINFTPEDQIKFLTSAFSRKDRKEADSIISGLTRHRSFEFPVIVQAMKNLAAQGDAQNFSVIANDEGFLRKALQVDEKIFDRSIAEIRQSANSKITSKDRFKTLINNFSAAISQRRNSTITQKEPPNLAVPSAKKSKQQIKQEKREAREKEENDLKEIREDRLSESYVSKASDQIIEDLFSSLTNQIVEEIEQEQQHYKEVFSKALGDVKEKAILTQSNLFLSQAKPVSQITDLPENIRDLVEPFLSEEATTHNFQIALKGSKIYKASSGKTLKNPRDIDLEVIASNIASLASADLKTLICQKLNLESAEFMTTSDSSNQRQVEYSAQNGDVISIFLDKNRDGTVRNFSAAFKSERQKIEISFYDADYPTKPEISWSTSLDARRLVFNQDGTTTERILEPYREFLVARNLSEAEEKFIINPRSFHLVKRLSDLIYKGAAGLEEVAQEIKANRIDIIGLLQAEFKTHENLTGDLTKHYERKLSEFVDKKVSDNSEKKSLLLCLKDLLDKLAEPDLKISTPSASEINKRKPNVIFTDCLKAIDCLVESYETPLQKAEPREAAKLITYHLPKCLHSL